MAELVTSVEPTLTWDVQTPHAVMVSDDFARTVLALNPHPDDADRRAVVLIWEGVRYSSMGRPGEDAVAGHHLYELGLRDLRGLGEVTGSELIARLDRADSSHPFHEPEWYADMRHHVLSLKESTVEVVAATLSVVRVAGSTAHAATRAESEAEPDHIGPVDVDAQ